MINIEYANACTEVLEILKYISKEDYNKIPKSKIDFYKENSNKDYSFTYNPRLTLDEQNVSKMAKGIIAILFRDCWATETQRNKIIAYQNNERRKIEEEKRKKYNVDNIFKERQNNSRAETVKKEEALIEIKEEKWYEKIVSWIKRILKKKQY